MYLVKDQKTNQSLVLCRTEIALEAACQTYAANGRKVVIEWTDTVKLIDPMEQ